MTTSTRQGRAEAMFSADLNRILLRTDRMFMWLLIGQWLGAIAVALVWSPRTWIAQYWSVHEHVLAAALLGALFAAYPIGLILARPGSAFTRHMIAIGQMLQSALLVHVTGGRIETHFHVFGSLALLAFYRDWRVLITAAVVVYVDHLALGIWFPLAVYGVPVASIWRSVEHAFWVIFELVFLAMSCRTGIRELRAIADRQALLQDAADELHGVNQTLEVRVQERTQELSRAKEHLEEEVVQRTRELVAAKQALEMQVDHRGRELELTNQQLEDQVRQLEILNRIMMNREERILELKAQLKALKDRQEGERPGLSAAGSSEGER